MGGDNGVVQAAEKLASASFQAKTTSPLAAVAARAITSAIVRSLTVDAQKKNWRSSFIAKEIFGHGTAMAFAAISRSKCVTRTKRRMPWRCDRPVPSKRLQTIRSRKVVIVLYGLR